MPGPQGVRETRPIPRRLLSPAAELRLLPSSPASESLAAPNPVSAPVHTMRAGAEPYPGTPDRHRVSKSSQTDARNNHREISACPHIRITTQRPSNHRQPCQTVTIRMPRHTEPHITHHQQPQQHTHHRATHAPAYATQQNPRTPRSPTQPTPPTRMRRYTNHDTSANKPWPSTTNHHGPYPPATADHTNRHQSILTTNAGAISGDIN